ncbi:MAG TPA: LPS export ABC transporter periplasmic protein LptC [Candidatus Dormibacteraeota bacterium]|nr:LPS export ABC transporter periplasmic protein LptC [Candidatus Dormibacteraeota bacterium]
MRRFAPLILLGFVGIVYGVGYTYYMRLKQQAASEPAKPKRLAPGLSATFHAWSYSHTSSQKTVITMQADDFQELDGKDELTGVTLDIYNKEGDQYDHIKSAKAEFDVGQGTLYSDGEVEITLNVPVDEEPTGRLMSITSSGVHVESKTGKANTDRLAKFKFDRGDGQAVGADYDPTTGELNLHSQVIMNWRGTDAGTIPMKIETDQLNYKERDGKVFLMPWSKLTRDTLMLNAGPAIVTIQKGLIQLVETTEAKGSDLRPGRNLDYAAKQLRLEFNDNNQIERITGVDQAHVVSAGETSQTTITSDRVVMDFDTTSSDSILKAAVAQGHSTMESKPVIKPGVDPSDTRVLKSDTIWTKMRPGGQEIDSVETQGPGAIEFLPNRPEQPHRWMNGEHIWMTYGPKNTIQSFRSIAVNTRTEKPKAKDAQTAPAPELTWSKNLVATFQPNSSQLANLDQSGDFRYEAGDRKAKAERALLDQPNNIINLIGGARMSDSTGSADADKIVMNQMSGDFTAEGNVTSTRMPDKKKDDSGGGGMLSEDEPVHARARKMVSKDNNLVIRYEGNAVLWQGGDRLEAETVEIDRDNNLLKAKGHVLSQLLDKTKDESKTPDAKAKTDPPLKAATKASQRVFTIVKAADLEYNDDTRLANYSGGATLERPDMTVKAQDIHAFLRNDSNDSSLDHALADGKVEIHQVAPDRTRDATSEHAEYFVDEDKVILEGGQPRFVDSMRGTTRGEKLTWYSADDRLLVNGVPQAPVKSVLHRKSAANK